MRIFRILAFWLLLLPCLLRAQTSVIEDPEWDFGYDWIAEYGGNLQDESGRTAGCVWWYDYNDIVAISMVSLPTGNGHYMRLKGFCRGTEWTGWLYRDDTTAGPIRMNWTFIPNGVTAWIEFRYTDLYGRTRNLSGWLMRRW